MREKGFALFLVLVLVALGLVSIGAVAYFQLKIKPVSQSTQTINQPIPLPTQVGETVNWKTYKNSTIGFTIKHPSHISVGVGKDIPGRRYFPVGGANKSPDIIATFLQKNPDFDPSQISPETLPFLEPIVTYDLWIEIGNIMVDTPADLKGLAEAYKEKDLFGLGSGSFPKDFGQIEPVTVGGESGYKISRLAGNVEYIIFLPGKESNQVIYIEARILPYTDPKSGAYTGEVSEATLSPRYEVNKNLFNLMLSTFEYH